MDTIKDFAIKQRKYMPVFPKATGKLTVYIEGYPCEDDEPMAETDFHADQIFTLSDQLKRYFAVNELVHIAVDSFVYYSEGDITKCVAPDIYIVFGVDKYPLRRSFYTWAEGAAPVAVFEFLSDSTAHQDRHEKVALYLNDIGVQEYFIHQPELKKPAEFRGWQRSPSGNIIEMVPDAEDGLFSEALNLWFRWVDNHTTHVRLLRPYLPDGTPITTSMEEEHLRLQEKHLREEAEAMAAEEAERRQKAEAMVAEEAERRRELETELERLRTQLANQQNETPSD
ncbi:MAG: Uma2 family endonuclease [Candidatus Poribacteria bacterium]|nr:Uma2 family endonuclease [Candidatus Poribacteria bacterium]